MYDVISKNNHIIIVAMEKATSVNPLNAELNPIRHLLALLEAHHILHISRIRVKHFECVCSPSYPACRLHESCCHSLAVWLYLIFPLFLTNSTIFGRELLNIKCVFWCSL